MSEIMNSDMRQTGGQREFFVYIFNIALIVCLRATVYSAVGRGSDNTFGNAAQRIID